MTIGDEPSRAAEPAPPERRSKKALGGGIGAVVGGLTGVACALSTLGHDFALANDPLVFITVVVGAIILGGLGAGAGAAFGGVTGFLIGALVERAQRAR